MNFFRDNLAPLTGERIVSLPDQTSETMEAPEISAQRLQKLGAQAAMIAHDLNNLLAPIVTSLDLIRPYLEDTQDLEMLEIAQMNTLRAADLVKQILYIARGVKEEHREIDPGILVEEIGCFARATFPDSIKVRVNAPNNLAPIKANATQLHRALLNLCINARDAMLEGGTLTVRAATVRMDTVSCQPHHDTRCGRYVLFEITDTGRGIPEMIRERIFDPFFTTKAGGNGMGLGLASVRSIVESHNGLLRLQTEQSRGTTFHILIPAIETSQQPYPSTSEIRIVAA